MCSNNLSTPETSYTYYTTLKLQRLLFYLYSFGNKNSCSSYEWKRLVHEQMALEGMLLPLILWPRLPLEVHTCFQIVAFLSIVYWNKTFLQFNCKLLTTSFVRNISPQSALYDKYSFLIVIFKPAKHHERRYNI